MLSTAIISATVLAEAAMGIKLFSTADIGVDASADAGLAQWGEQAAAQIESVSESLQFSSDLSAQLGGLDQAGDAGIDRFRNQYEDRNEALNNGTIDLNTLPDDYSDSGSFEAEAYGEYSDDNGSGDWGFNASASFSVSFNHEFRPHTPSPAPEPTPEPTPSPSPVPVPIPEPSPSPSPIPVNPCDCCDCGDGAPKVPLLFQRGKKENNTIQPVEPVIEGEVLTTYPNGRPERVRTDPYTVVIYSEAGEVIGMEKVGEPISVERPQIEGEVLTTYPSGLPKTVKTDPYTTVTYSEEGEVISMEAVGEPVYHELPVQKPEVILDYHTVEGEIVEVYNEGTPRKIRSTDGTVYWFNQQGYFTEINPPQSAIEIFNYPNGTPEPVEVMMISNESPLGEVYPNGVRKTSYTQMGDTFHYAPDGTILRRVNDRLSPPTEIIDEVLITLSSYADGTPQHQTLETLKTEFFFAANGTLLKTVYADGFVNYPGPQNIPIAYQEFSTLAQLAAAKWE